MEKLEKVIAGSIMGIIAAIIIGFSRCNNYEVNNPDVTVQSRGMGFPLTLNKIEYARAKNGSEEIMVIDGPEMRIYQNLDGDNTIDRIRTDKKVLRNNFYFRLNSILTRKQDYTTHPIEFNEADRLLIDERRRNEH